MRQLFTSAPLCLSGALFLSTGGVSFGQSAAPQPSAIIQRIQQLESCSDPKCHATASRLEDFMYGTPLSSNARFRKNKLLKSWVAKVWEKADQLADLEKAGAVNAQQISAAITLLNQPVAREENGQWRVGLRSGVETISARDKRQYASIAYALRAILAVKQEQLFSTKEELLPLQQEAVDLLKEQADVYALAVLKVADRKSRELQQKVLSSRILESAWNASGLATVSEQLVKGQQQSFMLPEIIKQKLASYQNYNKISNQLFIRNIQVYFAKRRWPESAEEGKQLKQFFTTAAIQYSTELYSSAQQLAQKRGEAILREQDVHAAVQGFTPFEVNQFEDVSYFPRLKDAEVTLEAYDLDAFRDSGLHWVYLKHAINESQGRLKLDADPFAAELLAESVAQFGVLTLRLAGEHAIAAGDERLSAQHVDQALRDIQKRISAHDNAPKSQPKEALLASSPENKVIDAERYFDDVTERSGVSMEHRSSDWLSRQLRSYLDKGNGVGVSTIPPAFGGSGIAAEDINNDGWPDLLILSGAGNRLYLNNKDKTFTDVTQQAGLSWKRSDGTYGEPRQPLIVDFDNDGRQDICITYVNDSHRMYRNKGNGTFEDVTGRANLGGKGLVGGPATVLDFDKDGLLDIYIGYFGNYLKGTLPTLARRNRNGLPNRLFRNTGNFTFEDVTEKSGTGDVGWAQAIGHSDFDSDGWQDLIVGNDFGVNVYFRNRGDGTFEDVSNEIGTGKPSFTMGIGITDLNQDQRPDYYISNIVTMNKDQKYTLPSADTEAKFDPEKLANMRVVEANDLFLSIAPNGSASRTQFELSKTVDRGYSSTGWSWDADFFDFDHDGDDDLYVLNGMNDFNIYSEDNPFYSEPLNNQAMHVQFANGRSEKNVFFTNKEGRLTQDSDRSGLAVESNSRSAAYFDYDGDGDLDIALNHYHGKVQIFENRVGSKSGNWVAIQSKRPDVVGAIYTVTTSTGRTLWREVHSTIGYLSVHPKQQHFGLGDSESATLKVTWPSGESSSHTLDLNQVNEIE